MLSLANSIGRILWSSTSDYLGRKNMYRIYLGVGALLYLALTLITNTNKVVFLLCSILILSFYGAGFATVPAYLRDLFGTYQVGAIHGRLLTAWSVAGVLGPLIVNAIADAQIAAGVEGPGRYTHGVLHHDRAAGDRVRLQRADQARERQVPRTDERDIHHGRSTGMSTRAESADGAVNPVLIGLAWLWVLIPLGYGLYQLVIKIPALFGT